MSGQILIQYDAVYSKTAELRQRIENELAEMEASYRQVQSTLRGMDGKANAMFIETMETNREKARLTADTLRKLLSFIENSARQVEQEERIIKSMFASTRIGIARGEAASNA